MEVGPLLSTSSGRLVSLSSGLFVSMDVGSLVWTAPLTSVLLGGTLDRTGEETSEVGWRRGGNGIGSEVGDVLGSDVAVGVGAITAAILQTILCAIRQAKRADGEQIRMR